MESHFGTRPDLPLVERERYTERQMRHEKEQAFFWGMFIALSWIAWPMLVLVGVLLDDELIGLLSTAFAAGGTAVAIYAILCFKKDEKEGVW